MSRLTLVRRLCALALAALVLPFAAAPGDAADRDRWDTRVFSLVPSPGYPAYVFAHPNGRVYAATYAALTGGSTASRVFEWTSGGTLLRSWTVPGQDLDHDPGVQVANADARGRLILLEHSTGKVMTLDIATGRFRTQAVIPDIPVCAKAAGAPCSPNTLDSPAIPNYATWGPDGALYLSDYGQAVIWRLPPRGGAPRIWFASKALDAFEFATTGLVYVPSQRAMLIGQQTVANLLANPLSGRLYRLPVKANGEPGQLSTLWRSRAGELPDGFGVARSGRIYVANVGLSNQLVVLSPEGRELERFPKTPLSGNNGSPIPFDGPSNATFAGTRVLVANQSPIFGDASHHAILDVEVGEPGMGSFIPRRSRLR